MTGTVTVIQDGSVPSENGVPVTCVKTPVVVLIAETVILLSFGFEL